HRKAIIPVYRNDVAVWRNRKSERVIQAPTLGDRCSRSCRRVARQGIRDGRDPVVETISDVERPPTLVLVFLIVIATETDASRANHQCGRVGSLGKPGTN